MRKKLHLVIQKFVVVVNVTDKTFVTNDKSYVKNEVLPARFTKTLHEDHIRFINIMIIIEAKLDRLYGSFW